MNIAQYALIGDAQTFAFSAENPTGARGGGGRGGDCTKLSPTVTIPAGKTVTLVDVEKRVFTFKRAYLIQNDPRWTDT